jgi:hypothetical protein
VPVYDVTLTPNWVSPWDPVEENDNAVWLYSASPTTPYRSPDSYHHQGRYLLLDPRAADADGRKGNDEWWFVLERYWPGSYPADQHGKWGREVNFHSVAGDSGPDGGVGWGFGSGVSSLALDWLPGVGRPQISIEPNGHHTNLPLPRATRDAWHTYVLHWVAGRTDGTTVHPGSVEVWVDGAAKPAIKLSHINTVQRAKGPDGNMYVQKWMQLWDGDYTSDLPVPSTVRLGLTRVGRTLAQALADRPHVVSTSMTGQHYRGSGVNHGSPSVQRSGVFAVENTALPASLAQSLGLPATKPKPAPSKPKPVPAKPKPVPAKSKPAPVKPRRVVARRPVDVRPSASVVSKRPIRWDGARFTHWRAFSAHLSNRGVDTNAFLIKYPTIRHAFGLQSLEWDGQRFYTRASFARWLRVHHQTLRVWAKEHPAASARLRG